MYVKLSIVFCCGMMMHLLEAGMMRDMAVMMGGQIGGTIANQAISSRFSDMQSALANDQTNITHAMSNFSTAVQETQKTELVNIFNLFSKVQSNISSLLSQQQAGIVAMDAYLQAALSRQQPQAEYLTNAVNYDQYFTLATMYTPQGAVWKNAFPVGNWEYDETSDSFWQMSNVSLLDANNAADQAPNNSIFTEWCTRSATYQIEYEVTLYNVTYPFFAGLIFNKARWISGDESRLQKYRLFGLYGDANSKLQVCFSEATIATPATATAAAVWNYPLAQIIAGSGTLSTKIDQTLLKNLKLSAVVFHIKIKNSPTKIQYKIWPMSIAEPTNFTTIRSNNLDLYLYHGIGFMAPGAIAEFKLLQPLELLFSDADKASFQGEVKAMIQKKLTTQFAANVDAAVASAGATT